MELPILYKELFSKYYAIANSSKSLYNLLKNDFYVGTTLASESTEKIIEEFKKIASQDRPKTQTDISLLYALIVALSFKNKDEVSIFYDSVKKIKFEWFKDIVFYCQNHEQAPPNILDFNLDFNKSFVYDKSYLYNLTDIRNVEKQDGINFVDVNVS